MNLLRTLLIWLLLLLAAGLPLPVAAADASGQGDWISYRDAYRTMLWFEKYAQPKHLILAHFRVLAPALAPPGLTSVTSGNANASGTALPGQLILSGKTIRLNLPLDDTGRVNLPLLKTAYDENAELQLPQKTQDWRFTAEISILIRADGMYDLADLRAACQQVLAYHNWRDPGLLRGKKCSGVRFVYAKKNAPATLALRRSEAGGNMPGAAAPLPALALSDGAAFWQAGEAGGFRIANVIFAALPEKAQVQTPGAPLAISALFE